MVAQCEFPDTGEEAVLEGREEEEGVQVGAGNWVEDVQADLRAVVSCGSPEGICCVDGGLRVDGALGGRSIGARGRALQARGDVGVECPDGVVVFDQDESIQDVRRGDGGWLFDRRDGQQDAPWAYGDDWEIAVAPVGGTVGASARGGSDGGEVADNDTG